MYIPGGQDILYVRDYQMADILQLWITMYGVVLIFFSSSLTYLFLRRKKKALVHVRCSLFVSRKLGKLV